MLTKVIRPLGQRQRMPLLKVQQIAWSFVFIGSAWLQNPLRVMWHDPDGLLHSWEILSQKTFIFYIGQQTNLLPSLERDTLFSQVVYYINILDNLVQNKRCQLLCSKDVQKYKGDMENCLPAITHLLWMNVPIIVAFYSSVSVAQAASFNSVSFTFYSMW